MVIKVDLDIKIEILPAVIKGGNNNPHVEPFGGSQQVRNASGVAHQDGQLAGIFDGGQGRLSGSTGTEYNYRAGRRDSLLG